MRRSIFLLGLVACTLSASHLHTDVNHRYLTDAEKATALAGGGGGGGVTLPIAAADVTPSSSRRFVTDAQITTWNAATGGGSATAVPFRTASGAGITPGTGANLQSALQTLIDGGGTIYLDLAGIYLIGTTLQMTEGCQLIGAPGAVLKGYTTVTGDLYEHMRYINIQNVGNCRVAGIKFQLGSGTFDLYDNWSNSVIFVKNSAHNVIEDCNFDFGLSYTSDDNIGYYAVWLGELADYNIFRKNYVKTLGVRYSEYGASYNVIEGNHVYHAFSNGFSGTGNNAGRIGRENKVLNNYVEGAGRMGIEDFSGESTPYLQGTEIRGNVIRDTGQTSGEVYGFGISADAYGGYIGYNKVFNPKVWGIEMMGNHGWTVENNETWSNSNEESGIIVNFYWQVPSGFKTGGAIVRANRIMGFKEGIKIKGQYEVFVTVADNQIYDWSEKGIWIDSDASRYTIRILNNNLFQRVVPTGSYRFGINNSDPGSPHKQDLTIQGNNIYYSAASDGGTGGDLAIRVYVDRASVLYNTVENYGETTNGGISAYGGGSTSMRLIGNTVWGATIDTTGYTSLVNENNQSGL